jgi:hypothetical protein
MPGEMQNRESTLSTLLPYAVDTPHFQVGANFVGRKPHAMPPVRSPEDVGRALVDLAQRPRRELHVPRSAAPSADPAAIQGRRGPRIGLPGLVAWLLGHYGVRGLRALVSS